MNKRTLENRIRSSFGNLAPDILESVLDDCDTQKGQVMIMQEKKKTSRLGKVLAGMAAALMLVVGMGVYHGNTAITSTVMLDVNPSIGITVNKGEKVLEVSPLNEDAKAVVGEMDFSGCSLEVTVNALIGSMLRCGYISDAANSILVTVDHDDPAAGQKMQEKLMTEINAILESGNIAGAVLGQTVTNDDETRKLAEQYGITSGKAQLIRQITAQNPLYSFEELVPLTINELNLISESGGKKLENVESIGSASSSGYIGEEAARNIALAHAGIEASHAAGERFELGWEGSTMVYTVGFTVDGLEYEYEINAETGEIIKCGCGDPARAAAVAAAEARLKAEQAYKEAEAARTRAYEAAEAAITQAYAEAEAAAAEARLRAEAAQANAEAADWWDSGYGW